MKRAVQIATVALALSMLAAFVVYSEQQAVRPTKSSKRGSALTSTNLTPQPAPPPAVAPGSKSLVLVRPPATTASMSAQTNPRTSPTGAGAPMSDIVASSSKSARILTPTQLAPDSPEVPSVLPSTNIANRATPRSAFGPGSKSTAPVIALRPEHFATPQTNPLPRKAAR